MKLFILKNYNLEIDKDEVLLHKPFAKIFRRDRNPNKTTAFKELKYIYCIADHKSKANQDGFNETETLKYALEVSELPNNYVPDELVLEAIQLYKKLNSTVVRETNLELLKTFNNFSKAIEILREDIEFKINELKTNSGLTVDQKNSLRKALLEQLTEVMTLSGKIPKAIDDLHYSIKKVKEEEDKLDGNLMRGGQAIVDSMDPENDI